MSFWLDTCIRVKAFVTFQTRLFSCSVRQRIWNSAAKEARSRVMMAISHARPSLSSGVYSLFSLTIFHNNFSNLPWQFFSSCLLRNIIFYSMFQPPYIHTTLDFSRFNFWSVNFFRRIMHSISLEVNLAEGHETLLANKWLAGCKKSIVTDI